MPAAVEILLMQRIREKFGPEIQEAAAGTLIPPEFLAALVANETGGDPTKKRFEKNVLLEIWEVIQGRAPKFGSINTCQIVLSMTNVAGRLVGPTDLFHCLEHLDHLATSWGLTQIMGYQSIPLGFDVADLQIPAESLHHTQRILMDFVSEFRLNPQTDAAKLFDCWNTGRLAATTMDPSYAANGLARMDLYRDLPPQSISA